MADDPQLLKLSSEVAMVVTRLDVIEDTLDDCQKGVVYCRESLNKIEKRMDRSEWIQEHRSPIWAKLEDLPNQVSRLAEDLEKESLKEHWTLAFVESENGRRVVWWICATLVLVSMGLAGTLTYSDLMKQSPVSLEVRSGEEQDVGTSEVYPPSSHPPLRYPETTPDR